MSTNTGPRSALRYTNQFLLKSYLWLCSSVDKSIAVDLKDPGTIPSQGNFFSLKFLVKRIWTKWWTKTTRTRTTTQVIPWSLADGCRQKDESKNRFYKENFKVNYFNRMIALLQNCQSELSISSETSINWRRLLLEDLVMLLKYVWSYYALSAIGILERCQG